MTDATIRPRSYSELFTQFGFNDPCGIYQPDQAAIVCIDSVVFGRLS